MNIDHKYKKQIPFDAFTFCDMIFQPAINIVT